MEEFDPPDLMQMPCPMIKLQSSDGEIFQVEVKVARLSLHLKRMMDDLGVEENELISIPQNGPKITGAILEKILQWAKHHKNDPAEAEDNEKDVNPPDDINSWDAEYLPVDPIALVQVIRAANYLDIKGLLDVACKRVAKMIKGMTPEVVRQTFNIPNDFSPDEKEQVRRENSWFEGFDCEENDDITVNSDESMDMQILDNGGGQDLEDCLNNSIVARNIFQHFSDPELLKLSFVNKLWNYEARSVIKNRGNLIARVRCTGRADDWSEGNVQVFLAATQKMNIVPFSGIQIHVQNHRRSEAFPNEAPNLIHDVNLDQLQLKKVSLHFYGANDDCPGLLLAKKVFHDCSEKLEELSLYIHADHYIKDVIQTCRFPLLKVLKLQKFCKNSYVNYKNDIKELVSRAPTLQELHTTGPIVSAFNALALERSSAVIVYIPKVFAPFDDVPNAAIGNLRLKNVELYYTDRWFNLDRFSQFAPVLLKDSCTTIRSMMIDTVLAVPLMCYGVNLERVESLDIRINYSQLELREPRILGIVKHFDFTRIFPNLKKVQIWDCHVELSLEHMNQIVERANAVLPDPMPDRAANVKELHYHQCYLSNGNVQFLSEMFPCIEKLEVYKDPRATFSFGSIWEHWTNLKELEVRGDITQNVGNLDSVFCGIFPDEIAELRQKDDEYLKRVHIVPVMPAITCLRHLKSLHLSHDGRRHQPDVHDGTLMFSKVTGFIAFARCPSLVDITLDFGNVPSTSESHDALRTRSYAVICERIVRRGTMQPGDY